MLYTELHFTMTCVKDGSSVCHLLRSKTNRLTESCRKEEHVVWKPSGRNATCYQPHQPTFMDLGPVSRKSRNFPGLFLVSQIPLYLENGGFSGINLHKYFVFCCLEIMLKDHLFITSGLHFRKRLFGPEKF